MRIQTLLLLFAPSFVFAQPVLLSNNYELIWHDEFNDEKLDTSKWIDSYLQYRVEEEERAKADYKIENGYLVLQINENKKGYFGDNGMKISSIQTFGTNFLHKGTTKSKQKTESKFIMRFGYIEVRAKGQPGSGHNSSFWALEALEGGKNVPRREIDIFEMFAKRDSTIKINDYFPQCNNCEQNTCDVPAKKGCLVDLNFNPTISFHTYGFEWNASGLNFYVDDVLVRHTNTVITNPLMFFLSLYESSGTQKKGGAKGFLDLNQSYPKEFYVDYIRAYQKKREKKESFLIDAYSPLSEGVTFDCDNSSSTDCLNPALFNNDLSSSIKHYISLDEGKWKVWVKAKKANQKLKDQSLSVFVDDVNIGKIQIGGVRSKTWNWFGLDIENLNFVKSRVIVLEIKSSGTSEVYLDKILLSNDLLLSQAQLQKLFN